MLGKLFFLINLELSLQALQNGNKIIIRDIKGLQGISGDWEKDIKCSTDYLVLANDEISTCYNREDETPGCAIFSLPYDVQNVSVLFVNVQTDERVCVSKITNCNKLFELLLINEKKRRIPLITPEEQIRKRKFFRLFRH